MFIQCKAQNYHVAAIGFYNLENLYDTEDDPTISDEEFTPNGIKNWTPEKYQSKLRNLSKVIADLGKDVTPEGLAILGVSEIENIKVLEDLVRSEKLNAKHYSIVHYNSPDYRGVDVALLYQDKYFKVINSWPIPLEIYNDDGSPRKTRDILLVKGEIEGQTFYITVNHWPSRRGGEEITDPYRVKAAATNKYLKDSLLHIDPYASFIMMGDLNDNPADESLKKTLQAVKNAEKVGPTEMYNPFFKNYSNGEGTTPFDDRWNLFDQIVISPNLLQKKENSYYFLRNQIYRKPFMLETSGHFKNYPKRTFSGDSYNDGFSDHFPVLIYLVKKV